ncbi:PhzF family phenazine biosynthesis isomerase [Phytohabitans sp. ZYX-F-186]|uniref:PhzF family phenazine biosynthesis isomerase n=1 Tax=Phytohabitans maris TaxID=3071409 RepID=A0ABU0ZW09_9ACTN|nr:PhzF family phenazine biosynthesis isomerase [Phytohabitans sp. ZYX-F-186]MDQ7911001.1 PhzF family phenazine biosynthesis isomerase [Phytohabitans sp. ZYX-F-186]
MRDGRGGSPTAVVDDPGALSDAERSRVPARYGTSHAVFVTRRGAPGTATDLRFFTAEGELPACGHGTVAAIAFLAARSHEAVREFTLRAAGRAFTAHATRDGDRFHTAFDPGPIAVREATPDETGLVAAALGASAELLAPGACVASPGRPRILIPFGTARAVAALTPDIDALRAACDRLGFLGCYVHTPPSDAGRVTARMFAPSIGVPEDIANANSTACLAAHLARRGVTHLSVDMGDSLGSPATITTTARRTPDGAAILVGGAATLASTP